MAPLHEDQAYIESLFYSRVMLMSKQGNARRI
jgi:hypothetical protein